MNLAFLDPFGPQIPDRNQSWIRSPFHRYARLNQTADADGQSCMYVAFNPHGNYIVALHCDRDYILAPVHDFTCRVLSSCCLIDFTNPQLKQTTRCDDTSDRSESVFASWSNDSRTLLLAERGSNFIFFINNTHLFGPELATCITVIPSCLNNLLPSGTNGSQSTSRKTSKRLKKNNLYSEENDDTLKTLDNESESGDDDSMDYVKGYNVDVTQYTRSIKVVPSPTTISGKASPDKVSVSYQVLAFQLPIASSGSVQIHPCGTGGLVCLDDGGLILFQLPKNPFHDNDGVVADASTDQQTDSQLNLFFYLVKPPLKSTDHEPIPEGSTNPFFVTCATFAENGNVIYATTSCHKLLALKLSTLEQSFCRGEQSLSSIESGNARKPDRIIKVPHDPTIRQIVVSRNGQMIALNCLDGVIRLYSYDCIWNKGGNLTNMEVIVHPKRTLQDIILKIKPWIDCDFSGNHDYLISGFNNKNNGGKYEIYVWDTVSGVCVHKLVGSEVELLSLSYHPVRPFIAVGTSDGMIDIWETKMDWKTISPNLHALQRNTIYMEQEDEYDIVIDRDEVEACHEVIVNEDDCGFFDVVTVDESKDECKPFYFDVAILGRNRTKKRSTGDN